MKKSILFVLAVLMVASLVAGCASNTSSSTGPALVTVKGKIASSPYVLDEAAFTKNAKELATFDPWVGDSGKDVTEKGILLKDLITMVKPAADVTTVSLIGTDGKAFDVPLADAQKYDIMLSHWVDGTMLEQKTGGPVKAAFPKDDPNAKPESWAWWVVSVEFK